MLRRFVKIATVLTILSVMGVFPAFTLAQTTDPLVGSWNVDVIVTSGCTTNCKYIGMVVFGEGGTTVEQRGTAVEYSGLGYVDRTALGKWWRPTTGTSPYEFKAKNFVFNATTGELSATIVGTSGLTLSSNLESFSGSGTAKIFNASGTLIQTENFTISGTRF
jgi:hypothetical protein